MKQLQNGETKFHGNSYWKVLLKFVEIGLFPLRLQLDNKQDALNEDIITFISTRRSDWLGKLQATIATMITFDTIITTATSVKNKTSTRQIGYAMRIFSDLKMAVFWAVAPCNLVEVYRRFRGTYCLSPEIGTSSIDWSQQSRFYLKTETDFSLRNVVLN
jgi:hypothetical protein